MEKKCNGGIKIRSSKYIRDLIKAKLYLIWTSSGSPGKEDPELLLPLAAEFGIRKLDLEPSS
jgi:hypothetical protein